MSAPAISVVLPTYNGSRYLAEAIDSCLCQTFTNWELIIVDDASTDATHDISDGYVKRDSRIRYIRSEINMKLPGALNIGFTHALGNFFTWTSDDNLCEPRWLSRLMEMMQSRSDIDIVYTDYALIDENGRVTTEQVTVKKPCYLVLGNIIGPSFLYRREVHEQLSGFDEALFLVEDYDFWLRASICFRMQAVHEVLYRYRIHGGSLTAQRQIDISLAHEKLILIRIGSMHWLTPRCRALGLIKASRMARARCDWNTANAILLSALRAAPITTSLIIVKMLRYGPDVIYRLPLDE